MELEEWEFEDKYPALAKRKRLLKEGRITKDQSGAKMECATNKSLGVHVPTTKEPYYGHE